jgi:hypothetical protein
MAQTVPFLFFRFYFGIAKEGLFKILQKWAREGGRGMRDERKNFSKREKGLDKREKIVYNTECRRSYATADRD